MLCTKAGEPPINRGEFVNVRVVKVEGTRKLINVWDANGALVSEYWTEVDEFDKENPKYVQAQKDGKPPMEYLVLDVLPGDALCHKTGADKYGTRNWRRDAIRSSTYEAAILRHFIAYFSGEDLDPDSGLSHLYHIRACCAVMLDAEMHDKLIDDRDRSESKDAK